MLMSKGVAHALDYDFRLVPTAVMAALQRRLEGGLRQTMSVILGSEVSELAWERTQLPTCFGEGGGWASGLLRWVLRREQRTGQLSTYTRQ